jgi:hypothetical protein
MAMGRSSDRGDLHVACKGALGRRHSKRGHDYGGAVATRSSTRHVTGAALVTGDAKIEIRLLEAMLSVVKVFETASDLL